MQKLDDVDVKLTFAAVKAQWRNPGDVLRFARDARKALAADDNLDLVVAAAEAGCSSGRLAVEWAQNLQREFALDAKRRDEASKKKPAKNKAENAKPAPA